MQPTIGFIGQGWIGKNFANDFERRGYSVVRYAKEAPYDQNHGALKDASIVFVAVPTPTTQVGFDGHILEEALQATFPGQTVVIKSTVIPGTTDRLAGAHPDKFILHSPEFLAEATVLENIEHPERNIIGIPTKYANHPEWVDRAKHVLSVLPQAPYVSVCTAPEAEIIKYGGNNFLFAKVVYMNMLYDLAQHHGADWNVISSSMAADSRIGSSHMQPVHQHAHMGKAPGRGAGGHCFIKDFAAMRKHMEVALPHEVETIAYLRAMEGKNNHLLRSTNKDANLLAGVYGDTPLCVCKVSDKTSMCVCRTGKVKV